MCVWNLGKKMVWHINYTYKIKRWNNIYANNNINFHSYIINIHSLNHKLAYDLHGHGYSNSVTFQL
jgi:hypothetical protein